MGGAMIWAVSALVAIIALANYPRAVLTVGGVCLAIIAVIVAKESADNQTWRDDQYKVGVTLSHDAAACGLATPIRSVIKNGTNKTVNAVEWSISANRPGFSTDLVDMLQQNITADKILAPGEGSYWCDPSPS